MLFRGVAIADVSSIQSIFPSSKPGPSCRNGVTCECACTPFEIGTIGPQPTLRLACLQTNSEAVESPNKLGTDVPLEGGGASSFLYWPLRDPEAASLGLNGILGHKAF